MKPCFLLKSWQETTSVWSRVSYEAGHTFYRKPRCSFVIWTAAPLVLSSSITCHRIGSGLKISSPPECHTVSCHLYPPKPPLASCKLLQTFVEILMSCQTDRQITSSVSFIMHCSYKVNGIWCTKVGGKCLFLRPKRRWKINIRTIHIVDCIRLSHDKDPRVPWKAEIVFSSWENAVILRRAVLSSDIQVPLPILHAL
jgi:hypothetical protein